MYCISLQLLTVNKCDYTCQNGSFEIKTEQIRHFDSLCFLWILNCTLNSLLSFIAEFIISKRVNQPSLPTTLQVNTLFFSTTDSVLSVKSNCCKVKSVQICCIFHWLLQFMVELQHLLSSVKILTDKMDISDYR